MEMDRIELEALVLDTFEKISVIQDKLSGIEESFEEELAALTHAKDLKKSDLYKSRDEILNTIPHFWVQSMLNHKVLSELVKEDICYLEFMDLMKVERIPDNIHQYKITFSFVENSYFKETTIVKILDSTDGHYEVSTVESNSLKWFNESPIAKQTTESNEDEPELTRFMELFDCENDYKCVELMLLLATDFYPNAVGYYQDITSEFDVDCDYDEDLEEELSECSETECGN